METVSVRREVAARTRLGLAPPVSARRRFDLVDTPVRQADRILSLQRRHGNAYVTRAVLRQPIPQQLGAPLPQQAPAAGGQPVARVSLAEMRTAAQGYITAYEMAAHRGVDAFQHDVASGFNWDLFAVNVFGNLVWAAAAFATGGTAFVISIAGIGISTAASAASVTNPPDFMRAADAQIADVVAYLNNQVDRVTRAVDADATAGSWDDNRTRTELLHRLLAPAYVATAAGGLPTVNTDAISALIEQQLLIRAVATQPASGPHLGTMPTLMHGYQGTLVYMYRLSNDVESSWWHDIWHAQRVRPVSDWTMTLRGASLVPSSDVPGAVNELVNATQTRAQPHQTLRPADWPIKKVVDLFGSDPAFPWLIIELDAANNVRGIPHATIPHENYISDNNLDRVAYARQILQRIWGGTTPPPVAGLTTPPATEFVPNAPVGPY